MELAYIPSPSRGVLHLGPIPLRGYAFCIIIGVFVAVWLGNKRWIARGGRAGTVADISVWAVPFGLVGGRLYHVITDYQLYFSEGRDWVDAFKIWEGGLGIWGAIAFGAVGAWIGCRRRGIPLPAWADALAPGIALAQAIGRWGNWFNQELYGRETDLPWALHITSVTDGRVPGYYHPTFLYESLWCVGVAVLVIWADRRFKLGHGRAFALYVAAYCVGRFWIEYMRVDEAHHVLGMRLNNWTAIVVLVLAVVYIVLSARLRPGREEVVEPAAPDADDDTDAVDLDKKSEDKKSEDGKSDADGDAESAGKKPTAKKPDADGDAESTSGATDGEASGSTGDDTAAATDGDAVTAPSDTAVDTASGTKDEAGSAKKS
ncbi:prolipoprotein diacylglyceryl transferase [Streptomyces fructofermentans]|uniref:Phosphatidylglycerol--prolipoprotein diacylglyceryl transferase n=1 Tax=Streptomyces fructofermentans TaxID=152141 RepID=A0A918KEV6_9ACTN|nr:prolipoprotein diacylglyceryl transferase [Streptomyces fructofermentans]GGX61207.1 prolipoprotein diacylglyceryl transferase 1 [Streptomyces fructofermentans]